MQRIDNECPREGDHGPDREDCHEQNEVKREISSWRGVEGFGDCWKEFVRGHGVVDTGSLGVVHREGILDRGQKSGWGATKAERPGGPEDKRELYFEGGGGPLDQPHKRDRASVGQNAITEGEADSW